MKLKISLLIVNIIVDISVTTEDCDHSPSWEKNDCDSDNREDLGTVAVQIMGRSLALMHV
jgi:hypothetical protein